MKPLRLPLFGLVALAALVQTGCDWTKPKVPGAEQRSASQRLATARRLQRACGSAETYDRLKALTFDEVAKLRAGGAPQLESMFANLTLRMEHPVAKSRDEQLDITVCDGHLVLDLPPGVRDAFNGQPQLEADVEYSAQQAADGSGLVYAMKGAEPIIYRLAALTLPRGGGTVPVDSGTRVASTPPLPAVAVPAGPAAAPLPAPVQATTPRPTRPAPVPPPAAADPLPAAPAPMTARPSFSCARVTGRVLRQICSDPDLATRDRRMSSAFYAALASGDEPTRGALRASRTRFLAFRDRCPTSSCVAQAYEDRIAEIRDIAGRR